LSGIHNLCVDEELTEEYLAYQVVDAIQREQFMIPGYKKYRISARYGVPDYSILRKAKYNMKHKNL
jgi:hypothetical protein